MDRHVYRVMPHDGSDEGWKVESDGTTVNSFDRKEDAVAEGRRLAQNNEPSQLVVHTADGKIEDERTYRDDPFPPRG